jgi:hypothetical protein
MVKAIRASVLILLLACSAQAGYMPSGSEEPPPPPPPATALVEEEEMAEDSGTTSAMADTLTEVALSVLNNALALL